MERRGELEVEDDDADDDTEEENVRRCEGALSLVEDEGVATSSMVSLTTQLLMSLVVALETLPDCTQCTPGSGSLFDVAVEVAEIVLVVVVDVCVQDVAMGLMSHRVQSCSLLVTPRSLSVTFPDCPHTDSTFLPRHDVAE